jgi:hypothetical protein
MRNSPAKELILLSTAFEEMRDTVVDASRNHPVGRVPVTAFSFSPKPVRVP